jgi:hypothetical protein
VNFIGRDNEAQHLTFEILSQKLDLFGKVLDASDTVLHEPRTDSPELVASAVSLEFENDLRSIYGRARTAEEISRELVALRDRIEARREAYEREYTRTSQIIESRFDQQVRRAFRRLRDELPAGLVQLDHDVASLVEGYLGSRAGSYTRTQRNGWVIFEIGDGFDLGVDVGDDRRFATGDARGVKDAQSLNLVHPLVSAAVEYAKSWNGGSVELCLPPGAGPELAALAGQTGALAVARVDYSGFEPVQRLVSGAVVNGAPIDAALASRLSQLEARECPMQDVACDPQLLSDVVEEAAFIDQQEVEKAEQKHFEQAIGQLERFVEDKVLVCRRERGSVAAKLDAAKTRRDGIVGAAARERVEAEILRLAERHEELDERIAALESRKDEVYRKWRNQYDALRYQAPSVTRLFQVTFRIAQTAETSC